MADFDVNFILRVTDQTAGAVNRMAGQFRQARKEATGGGAAGSRQRSGLFGFHGSEMYQGAAAVQHLTGMTKKAIAAPLALALEFEQAEKRVNALSGGALKASGNLAALTKRSRELGASTEFTASQVLDSFGVMTKAGFKYGEQLNSVSTILDLSTAGEIGLDKSTDLTASALGGFGLEASEEQVKRVGNVINRTSKAAQISIGEVGNALKYAAPNASKLGIEIESVAEATAILGAAGVKGGMAGTSMRSFFNRLAMFANEDLATPAQNKAAKMLGLDRKGLQAALDTGNLQNISKFMGDTVKNSGLGKTDQVALLQKMFRERGALGAQILMASATADEGTRTAWGTIAESVNNTNVTLEKSANEMRSSGKAGLKEYESAMQELGIVVGKELLPELIPLLRLVTELTRDFAKWAAKHPTLIKVLGLTAVAVVGVGTVLAPLMMSIASFNVLTGLARIGVTFFARRLVGLRAVMTASNLTMAGGILAAATLGWTIGTLADEYFGISDSLSKFNAGQREANMLMAQGIAMHAGISAERDGAAKFGSMTKEERARVDKLTAKKNQLGEKLAGNGWIDEIPELRGFGKLMGVSDGVGSEQINTQIQSAQRELDAINKKVREREKQSLPQGPMQVPNAAQTQAAFGADIAAQLKQIVGEGMKGTLTINAKGEVTGFEDEGDIPLQINSGLVVEGV